MKNFVWKVDNGLSLVYNSLVLESKMYYNVSSIILG